MSEINVTSLAKYIPIIRDQGISPTCVAESVCQMLEFSHKIILGEAMEFSRDSIYGNPFFDSLYDPESSASGLISDDVISRIREVSAVPEKLMPMVPNQGHFDIRNRYKENITPELEEEAKRYTYSSTTSISRDGKETFDHVNTILENPSKFTLPLVAIRVYPSFYDARYDPTLKDVDKSKEESVGGHAMVIVGTGYIGDKRYYIVQNSWGEKWGHEGKCFMPEGYAGITGMFAAAHSPVQFGVSKDKVEECHRRGLPEIAHFSGYKCNKLTISESFLVCKDMHFDEMFYAESIPTMSKVALRIGDDGKLIESEDIKYNKSTGVTRVKLPEVVKLAKWDELHVSIDGAQNILGAMSGRFIDEIDGSAYGKYNYRDTSFGREYRRDLPIYGIHGVNDKLNDVDDSDDGDDGGNISSDYHNEVTIDIIESTSDIDGDTPLSYFDCRITDYSVGGYGYIDAHIDANGIVDGQRIIWDMSEFPSGSAFIKVDIYSNNNARLVSSANIKDAGNTSQRQDDIYDHENMLLRYDSESGNLFVEDFDIPTSVEGVVKINPTTTVDAIEGLRLAIDSLGDVKSVNGMVGEVTVTSGDIGPASEGYDDLTNELQSLSLEISRFYTSTLKLEDIIGK